VDVTEFACGMSLLCKGPLDHKLELAFEVYDIDGDGFITSNELMKILHDFYKDSVQVLRILEKKRGENLSLLEFGVEQVENEEQSITDHLLSEFRIIDTNGDDKISFQEFAQLVNGNTEITEFLERFNSFGKRAFS